VIEIRGLTHRFGRRSVLDGADLTVESGVVVGLVGPNGAGKTTLLRSIATLLEPDAGSIRVEGCDARVQPAEVRRAMGYLPERANAYPDLTAWEYLDLFGEIAGLAPGPRGARIEESLAQAGLSERRDQLVGELSKGLRQRLALQSVLLHEPKALVLDEPTDGLDPESRARVSEQVRSLARRGRAVLVSSHILEELALIADRVVALVGGRLLELRAAEAPGWAIQLRDDVPTARVVALGVTCVSEAVVEGERLILTLKEGTPDASAVATALAQAGFSIVSVAERSTTLHELYRRAVGGPG
jgi:ABC-2 type transport system ATP-binding protein